MCIRDRATTALTAVEFGLVGLDRQQTEHLTKLLTEVRRAAGDFTESR